MKRYVILNSDKSIDLLVTTRDMENELDCMQWAGATVYEVGRMEFMSWRVILWWRGL